MNLTDKELEIMQVLWGSDSPMTIADIIAASPKRTWQEISANAILKNMVEKGVVVVDHYVPTTGRSAKAYKAVFTAAQCALKQAQAYGVGIEEILTTAHSDEKLVECLLKKGWIIRKDESNCI